MPVLGPAAPHHTSRQPCQNIVSKWWARVAQVRLDLGRQARAARVAHQASGFLIATAYHGRHREEEDLQIKGQ